MSMKYEVQFKVNSEAFINENATSFYLLGAYMSDGCILSRTRTQLTSADRDWLEAIRDIVSPGRPLNGPYKDRNCYELKFTDRLSTFWLKSYGCTPAKSYSLSIADEIPPRYRRDLVRGVMDGDGCISIVQGNQILVDICSVSRAFLLQLQGFIPEGIRSYIYKREKRDSRIHERIVIATTDQYTLRLNGRHAQQFLKWIYYPNHALSMPRKRQKAKEARKISYGSKTALNKEDVINIKRLLAEGTMKGTEIARRYGVNKGTIYCIAQGKTWKIVS